MVLLALVPDRLRAFADMGQENVRQVFYGMIPAGIVLLMHYYFSRGNTDLLCRGLFYFVLPIFGAVYAGELKKPLLWAVLLLGGADLGVLLWQCFAGLPPYGITGNWNWSATLLLAGILAGTGLAGKKKTGILLAAGACLMMLIYTFVPGWQAYFPRGTVAAGGMVSVAAACCAASGKRARLIRWGAGLLLLAAAVLALVYIEKDVTRSSLAEGALQIVKSYPLAGVGPGRFESEIPSFLPARYFDGEFPSERHPHCHNQLLQMMAEFGLAGAVLFGVFCLILFRAGRKCRAGEDAGMLWIIAVLLTLHGMADVLLEAWPLHVIWLLAIGVLWGSIVTPKALEIPEMEKSDVYWPLRVVQVILCVLLAVQVVREGTSGFYARRAKLGGGAADWAKSRMWKVTPENLYAGAMHELFDRKDPAAAMAFLNRMEPETTFRNYLHSQGLMARCLAVTGKLQESLPCFEAEQRNFPVSAANLYFYAGTLQKLGRKEKAAETWRQMEHILRSRGRTPADLPGLIRDPGRELRRKE